MLFNHERDLIWKKRIELSLNTEDTEDRQLSGSTKQERMHRTWWDIHLLAFQLPLNPFQELHPRTCERALEIQDLQELSLRLAWLRMAV